MKQDERGHYDRNIALQNKMMADFSALLTKLVA